LFKTNQKQLYQELGGQEKAKQVVPDATECKKFWSDLCDQLVQHNSDAEWLSQQRTQAKSIPQQANICITRDAVEQQLKGMANRKSMHSGLRTSQSYMAGLQISSSSVLLRETELNAYGTMLGEVNIRRGIFQGDSLSPLLFIITIIPLTCMLRQSDTGYRLGDGHSKINHLLFMDDLKLYGRNNQEIESLVHTCGIFSEDIGMQFGIEKCATIKLQRGKV